MAQQGTTSVSEAIVEAVADREGVAPTELEPPLFEAVNPDALDALFADIGPADVPTGPTVTFRYKGYLIMVSGTGQVGVD